MATIRKRGNSWNVQIRKRGHKQITKSFKDRKLALTWIKKVENEMERGVFQDTTEAQRITFNTILDKYKQRALITKRGIAQEESRIKYLKEWLGDYSLAGITPAVLSKFRDWRGLSVAAQTVKHDLSLISRIINYAIKDLGYSLPYGNPVQQIRMPKIPRGRTRRLEPGEQELLLENASESLQPVILFALETAMRRGEIANMEWRDVDLKQRTLHIPETKTGIPRTIPLSSEAIKILKEIPLGFGPIFKVHADSMTKAFDRATNKAGIEDLRFHDLRHEATSRLFEKGLNHTEVASITGHKDLKMLLRYTHLRATDLVSKIG
ncbi:site-specific integrase [Nitrosococcus watsonii]|uniref:Integrase family protein n=1 Tax=Nitrosococcus watsoni (strain C-113) TaxID=105559 RepID=D8K7N5_NITWC|nr:site-specific integrase [Nitrosococcus watsonii]ADJ28912.1 integrase family protein [Nitrosococcus watsonii C-113]